MNTGETAMQRRAAAPGSARPRIAFFDYPDVFEDFYPHYGIEQVDFATRWSATGNHQFVPLIQRELHRTALATAA